eukprot:156471-Pelagomonas_calceolata.AAC.2
MREACTVPYDACTVPYDACTFPYDACHNNKVLINFESELIAVWIGMTVTRIVVDQGDLFGSGDSSNSMASFAERPGNEAFREMANLAMARMRSRLMGYNDESDAAVSICTIDIP